MIAFLLQLTLRQQIFRRSTLLLVGLSLLPVLVALVFRLAESEENPLRWTAVVLYRGLIITAVLPLTALMFGTTAIGDELEDGTAVYLLTKPLSRWQILVPKVLGPWLITSSLLVASAILAGLLATQGEGGSLIFGTAIALALGALAYTMVFVLLSVFSTHALIAGLVYVFIWEGAMSGIFEGLRFLSIRHYTIGLSDWIAGAQPGTSAAYVGGETALILVAIVMVAAAFLANRRLQQVEIREPS